jgi:amidohydrolase
MDAATTPHRHARRGGEGPHDRRGELAGRVLFVFQPGEEGYHGARYMLEEGLLDARQVGKVVRAFALHQRPAIATGTIMSRPGTILASADTFHVVVTGRGGHAAMPHTARDPIPVICELVQAIQTAVTRRVDVFDPVVVSVTQLMAGTTVNVIPIVRRTRETR